MISLFGPAFLPDTGAFCPVSEALDMWNLNGLNSSMLAEFLRNYVWQQATDCTMAGWIRSKQAVSPSAVKSLGTMQKGE